MGFLVFLRRVVDVDVEGENVDDVGGAARVCLGPDQVGEAVVVDARVTRPENLQRVPEESLDAAAAAENAPLDVVGDDLDLGRGVGSDGPHHGLRLLVHDLRPAAQNVRDPRVELFDVGDAWAAVPEGAPDGVHDAVEVDAAGVGRELGLEMGKGFGVQAHFPGSDFNDLNFGS